jgi:hypothetical protein
MVLFGIGFVPDSVLDSRWRDTPDH